MKGLPVTTPGSLNAADKLVPNLCMSPPPKPVLNEAFALPSRSTAISYQRAPTVSSTVSDRSIASSPNTPFCLSVLLISLINITGGI